MVETPLPERRDRVFLNGATIMTTPTERHIEIARETGYEGVEVRAERLLEHPEEVRAAAAMVRPHEVWSLNGIGVQLTTGEALDRASLLSDLEPRLAVCEALGADYLLIVPPRSGPADRGRAMSAIAEGVERVRDAASERGVRVAFEFLGFGDCPVDSPALAAELVEGLEGVELVLDSCHWHASGAGSLDAFPVERLAMVHLNDAPEMPPREIEDADRLLPGEGVIQLAELVRALPARGYAGPWSLETFNPAYWQRDPSEVALEGRSAVRRVLESGA